MHVGGRGRDDSQDRWRGRNREGGEVVDVEAVAMQCLREGVKARAWTGGTEEVQVLCTPCTVHRKAYTTPGPISKGPGRPIADPLLGKGR